ncbi:hypothetical protein [Streptomyces chartreusis]|uniref:hypothetical protein n=1 Tax=Streptomyces chartreusis TaxID=1969 RepID=UPI0036408C41
MHARLVALDHEYEMGVLLLDQVTGLLAGGVQRVGSDRHAGEAKGVSSAGRAVTSVVLPGIGSWEMTRPEPVTAGHADDRDV